MNPALRGMGHTGWGEQGNPTHCIRFTWDDDHSCVKMNYKNFEADEKWLPTRRYNEESGNWDIVVEGFSYNLISTVDTASLLEQTPETVPESTIRESLKSLILGCSEFLEGSFT